MAVCALTRCFLLLSCSQGTCISLPESQHHQLPWNIADQHIPEKCMAVTRPFSPAVLQQHCSKKITNGIKLPDRSAGNKRPVISLVERTTLSIALLPSCCWRLLIKLLSAASSCSVATCPCHLPFCQSFHVWDCPSCRRESQVETNPATHTQFSVRSVSTSRDRWIWARSEDKETSTVGVIQDGRWGQAGGRAGSPIFAWSLLPFMSTCCWKLRRWWRKALALHHLTPVQLIIF